MCVKVFIRSGSIHLAEFLIKSYISQRMSLTALFSICENLKSNCLLLVKASVWASRIVCYWQCTGWYSIQDIRYYPPNLVSLSMWYHARFKVHCHFSSSTLSVSYRTNECRKWLPHCPLDWSMWSMVRHIIYKSRPVINTSGIGGTKAPIGFKHCCSSTLNAISLRCRQITQDTFSMPLVHVIVSCSVRSVVMMASFLQSGTLGSKMWTMLWLDSSATWSRRWEGVNFQEWQEPNKLLLNILIILLSPFEHWALSLDTSIPIWLVVFSSPQVYICGKKVSDILSDTWWFSDAWHWMGVWVLEY